MSWQVSSYWLTILNAEDVLFVFFIVDIKQKNIHFAEWYRRTMSKHSGQDNRVDGIAQTKDDQTFHSSE